MPRLDAPLITAKEASQHRTLWLAVILQAMEDYGLTLRIPKGIYKRKNTRVSLKLFRITKDYFYTDDFLEVCENAGVVAVDVRTVLAI